MGKIKYIAEERFGKLLVLSFSHIENKRAFWNCECECGKVKAIRSHDLLMGKVNSCGCLKVEQAREKNYKHGHSVRGDQTRAWNIWRGMTERCRNTNHISWSNYGGRGIKVCPRWLEFSNFLADMGEPEKDFSLDRINKDGDYCPENCHWADKATQARNTNRNIMLTYNGKTQCITDWARELKIHYGTIKHRLKRDWSIEEALTTPVTRYISRAITSSISRYTNADKATQARNTNRNIMLTYNGKTQCITDWARELKIHYETIKHRLKQGWSIEEALTTPVTRYINRSITSSISRYANPESKTVHNFCGSPGYIAIEDTQILTSMGWVDALDIDGTEELAQMSDKNQIVFEKPSDVIK